MARTGREACCGGWGVSLKPAIGAAATVSSSPDEPTDEDTEEKYDRP